MKSVRTWFGVGIVLCAVASALASPAIDSAVVNARVFNDYPGSTFSSINTYPAHVQLKDLNVGPGAGWANRHNFRLSDNGGVSEAVFMNADGFGFWSDVNVNVLGGGGGMEAGIQLSPWWSKEVDGQFNLRPINPVGAVDGEVAVFGGRLPFYSFTAQQGVLYANNTTVRLGMIYVPNGLNAGSPAQIQYSYYDYGSATMYKSPWLYFDMANPAEDPPYGLWGDLNDARVGGFGQFFGQNGVSGQVDFGNMKYVPEPTSMVLLSIAALAALRRRR